MAQKRMFDRSIIDNDNFMDLPMGAKALYFLLGMEADDEGFVSPRKVLRLYGGTDDEIKVLIAKGFIIPFESGVVVITHFHQNNFLDKNRVKPTIHQKERESLAIQGRKYVLNDGLTTVKPGEERREEERTGHTSGAEEKIEAYGIRKNVMMTKKQAWELVQLYGPDASKDLVDQLSTYMAQFKKDYPDHFETVIAWAQRKEIPVINRKPGPKRRYELSPDGKTMIEIMEEA